MTDNDEVATIVVGEQRHSPVVAARDWPMDGVCAAAVQTAREALLEEADPAQVGDPLGMIAEGPLVVTHYFEATVPGYLGWRWAVTVTRAPDSEHVTVDETALLPDGTALLAPVWVPWRNRVQSGDLGAGDVLVTALDDPRLVPGLAENDTVEAGDDGLEPAHWQAGLGRLRMLSPEGRREAAHRWYREAGPRSPIARAADLQCATCGFLLLVGGPLGQAFGICANGFAPVDGRMVAMDFGCGAHSETVQVPTVPVADTVIDEVGFDAMPDEPDPEEDSETGLPESVGPGPETQGEAEPPVESGTESRPDDGDRAPNETMQESDTEEGS